MDRDGMWQGIRDWFRPATTAHREARRRGRSHAPIDSPPPSHEGRSAEFRNAAADEAPRSAGGGTAVLEAEREELELLEFLAADLDPVQADPAFRERLREELWEMVVRDGAGSRSE